MNKPRFSFLCIAALLASCGQTSSLSSSESFSSSEVSFSSEAESSISSSEVFSSNEESSSSSNESSSIESSEETSSSQSSEGPDYTPKRIQRKIGDVYGLYDANPLQGYSVNLYTINDNQTYYYFELQQAFSLFGQLQGYSPASYFEMDGLVASFRNEKGDGIIFDVENNSITFTDYGSAVFSDIDNHYLTVLGDQSEHPSYLRVSNPKYNKGHSETYCLDDYGMKLYMDENGHYFAPASMLAEILMGSDAGCAVVDSRGLLFNSSANFKNPDGTLNAVGRFYYDEKESVSEEFAEANYNLLCLDMDMQYGLGYSHGIDHGFDDWIKRATSDTYAKLRSTDPKEFEEGLAKMTLQEIDDVHTKYVASGIYAGDCDPQVPMGLSRQRVFDIEEKMQAYRKEAIPDFMPYMEYGDTAFVTFDAFSLSHLSHYQRGFTPRNSQDDTMELISYANRQIKREGSPIKNVVLDLSCNGGGAYDTAVYVLAWMLGEVSMALRDPISGSTSLATFEADVNFDHDYDEKDTISNLNLYCMATGGSFSCGNLVPCVLRASDRVTMLGQTSGGGSCAIAMRSTLGGSIYRISSRNEICTYKNGTYYSVDQGAEPHYFLRNDEFYAREDIAAKIGI